MGVTCPNLQVLVVPTVGWRRKVPVLVGTNHPAVAALIPEAQRHVRERRRPVGNHCVLGGLCAQERENSDTVECSSDQAGKIISETLPPRSIGDPSMDKSSVIPGQVNPSYPNSRLMPQHKRMISSLIANSQHPQKNLRPLCRTYFQERS